MAYAKLSRPCRSRKQPKPTDGESRERQLRWQKKQRMARRKFWGRAISRSPKASTRITFGTRLQFLQTGSVTFQSLVMANFDFPNRDSRRHSAPPAFSIHQLVWTLGPPS